MTAADLIAELAKKSGLVWVSYAGHTRPVWHTWVGDAVCVVVDGAEQPLPDITSHETVTLLLRSKTTRALVAEVVARVDVVTPGSEHWDPVTTSLKSGRLNLTDAPHAIERWARESTVVRFVPTAELRMSDHLETAIPRTRPHLSR